MKPGRELFKWLLPGVVALLVMAIALLGCAQEEVAPAEEPGITPATSLTQMNQEKLDAAIQASDIEGILRAIRFTKEGLIPESGPKQQWEKGSLALSCARTTSLVTCREPSECGDITRITALDCSIAAPVCSR
ncbi:hypothetical protein ES703_109573 [subsurface metagenome]